MSDKETTLTRRQVYVLGGAMAFLVFYALFTGLLLGWMVWG